jgi:hypothetical protein
MYCKNDFRTTKTMLILSAMMVTFASITMMAMANQVGVNFSEDAIGALGDYQHGLGETYEFEVDAQAQKADSLSLAANVSAQRNFGAIGIKPFASYNRDDVGNTLDAGGLINFSIGALDIAAGASFRGANPTAAALQKRFDANGVEVEVHKAGYSPNAYTLPAENNVNAVLNTGFYWRRVETGLTGYVPITKRDIVPIVIISRSQISVALAENLSLAVVVDARTYLHTDGAELSFKPLGAVTYKF